MSTTPRTDSLQQGLSEMELSGCFYEMYDHARQLETELNAAKADCQELLKVNRELLSDLSCSCSAEELRQVKAGYARLIARFPHSCCDKHELIGFSNGPAEEAESCPVCMVKAENDKLRELGDALYEHAVELAGLQSWKRNSTESNDRDMERLDADLAAWRKQTWVKIDPKQIVKP